MVASGQTAQVIVILQCSLAAASGEVAIHARLDQCPFITGISASRLQAPVGGDITVGVAATDLDGDPIGYAWTSTPATSSLAPLNAATAVFHCSAVGTTELSIAVSEERHRANPARQLPHRRMKSRIRGTASASARWPVAGAPYARSSPGKGG